LESVSSREIVHRLSEFDLDLGMTYVDGEPLGPVRVLPLYRERYRLLTPREGEFAGRASISWAAAASTPLCLLSPVMENRRILDRNGELNRAATSQRPPTRELNSRLAVAQHP